MNASVVTGHHLDRLIEACNDAERAYRSAAQRAADPAVRKVLRHIADRRHDCVLALSNLSAGESARSAPGEPGSKRPALDTFSLDDWLLRGLRAVEERSLVAFSETLALAPAIRIRTVVEECYREVRRAYGALVSLSVPPTSPSGQAPRRAATGRPRRGSGPSAAVLGAALALAILGGFSGWLLRQEVVESHDQALRENRFLHTLLDAHQLFTLDPPSGVMLPPDELASFASQIDQQLKASIRLPAPDVWPHPFLGGRILPLGPTPAVLLLFARDHDTVSVYVARDQASRPWSVHNQEIGDDAVSFAREGSFQVGVVGVVSPDEFATLKQVVGEPDRRT